MPDTAHDLLTRAAHAKRENRLTDARQDALQAIALLRQQSPGIELAKSMRLLAEVERKLHDGVTACRHYEEATELCRAHADPLTLAHTVRHLGDVYHETRQPELAENCYREALALYRLQTDAPLLDLANAVRSLAVLKGEMGEIAEAKSLWQEARDLYATVKVTAGVAESSRRLAQLAE